ncbi:unnamed protein product, partial [Prorocentrum cordatum]
MGSVREIERGSRIAPGCYFSAFARLLGTSSGRGGRRPREALGSLDQLRQAAEDGRRRADALEASVRKVQGGGRAEGDEPSSGLGRLFGPRDRAGQPDRLRRELEQTREEAAVAEEWHAAARSVAAGLEVGAFLAEK